MSFLYIYWLIKFFQMARGSFATFTQFLQLIVFQISYPAPWQLVHLLEVGNFSKLSSDVEDDTLNHKLVKRL
jgi:hypothetical protein